MRARSSLWRNASNL